MLTVFIFSLFYQNVLCHKSKNKQNEELNIILLHGINSNYQTFDPMIEWFQVFRPLIKVVALDFYNDLKSYDSLMKQVPRVMELIEEEKLKGGFDEFILIGHSQGALIGRCVVEMMENSGIKQFISLAGPLRGQYGIPSFYFPDFLKNMTLSSISELLYEEIWQNDLSFANYWNDPLKHDLYLDKNMFLPIINNEVDHEDSEKFKNRFLSLEKMVVFSSPKDSIIKPWISEQFGFYKEEDCSTLLKMEETEIYQKDLFGLKTLKEDGRLFMYEVKDVDHSDWVNDQEIFFTFILPHIDNQYDHLKDYLVEN